MSKLAPLLPFILLSGIAISCTPSDEKAKPQSAPSPAVVVVAPVTDTGVTEKRRFFAEVVATSDAHLSAAEAGRVLKVTVREGDKVKKGQLLVELDAQLARAQLSEALATKERTQVERDQAKLEVSRYETMRQEQVVSDLEALRKQNEAHSLSAEAQGAVAQVARETEVVRRHRIVAPFSGTVAVRNVDPGDWINPGEIALQLLTDEHPEVQVRVPGTMLSDLPQVTQVWLESEERRVPARVEASVNALDPTTRTGLLRLTPSENVPEWLRVGSSVFASFTLHRAGLTIPRDAVVYGVAEPRVMRVQNAPPGSGKAENRSDSPRGGSNPASHGKVEAIPIAILIASGNFALVQARDLSVGDLVVTKGNERLRPGQEIKTQGALVPGSIPSQNPGASTGAPSPGKIAP